MHSVKPTLKERLEEAIDEMVEKGILWSEASAQFEKLFILRCLRDSGGNLCRAADKMGVHRNTLSKKVRIHRIGLKKK
jgi:Fis family transcriptional regulator, factor for inversion stimulation protein